MSAADRWARGCFFTTLVNSVRNEVNPSSGVRLAIPIWGSWLEGIQLARQYAG